MYVYIYLYNIHIYTYIYPYHVHLVTLKREFVPELKIEYSSGMVSGGGERWGGGERKAGRGGGEFSLSLSLSLLSPWVSTNDAILK